MEAKKQKIRLALFLLVVLLLLGGTAAVVFLVDPFFHYHAPWFGLKAVEDEKEYQIPGMIDHFSYDSILAGSSVVMSMDLQELDREFSCNAIKAVGGSAPAPLLAWYLERAFARQELRYVFYGLDVFSFYNDPDMPVIDEDVSYLVNAKPFEDVRYLWNKDIITEKIPQMIQQSADENYDWGMIYQVNVGAKTGPEEVLKMHCPNPNAVIRPQPVDYRREDVAENLTRLETLVREHPDTEFLFFIPPYSVLWWDNAYESGLWDTYLYTLEDCMARLLSYDNVGMYATYFNDKEVIGNLYLYMDYIHAATPVTEQLPAQLSGAEQEITVSGYKQELQQLSDVFFAFRRKVEAEGYGFVFEVEQNW